MAKSAEITAPAIEDPDTGDPKDMGLLSAGLILVYTAGQPVMEIVPLGDSDLEMGRTHPVFRDREDRMMSRRHARVVFQNERFEITDLGSRNGSFLDGRPVVGSVVCSTQRVLRLGHTLFLLCHDLEPFRALGVRVQDGRADGPALQRVLQSVVRLAEHSRTLFITGESGVGKESIAQAFHRAGPQRRGPFIAVNCATIPEGLAERLLFGAQRGAYTGAAHDSEGYLQAANGGTLFLDEVADLDTTVQAKLLRALESREVLPLGATRPQQVELRVCSATHKDLRAQTAAGLFRADLYFRLGMPQVAVPPLRKRLAEIPWLVTHATSRVAPELPVTAQLVEACLLRDWPGNIRELFAELNTAAVNALSAGAKVIGVSHLSHTAGTALAPAAAPERAGPLDAVKDGRLGPGGEGSSDTSRIAPTRALLMQVLFETKGNLSASARVLGLHRTQLRRILLEYGINLARVRELHKP
jgi:DNA-binding NtrC family response regulator